MSNTCAVNQQMFCKHFVMIIASGRQVISLPEFITGHCAIMTNNKILLLLFGSLYSNVMLVLH